MSKDDETFSLDELKQLYQTDDGKPPAGVDYGTPPPMSGDDTPSHEEPEDDSDLEDLTNEPEPEDDDEEPEVDERNGKRTVDHGAFAKERALRKKLQSEAAEQTRRIEVQEARLQQIMEMAQRMQPQQAAQPEQTQQPQRELTEAEQQHLLDTNPAAYIQYMNKQLQEVRQYNNQQYAAQQQNAQQQELLSRVNAAYSQSLNEFVAKSPDLPHAVEHLRNIRTAQMTVWGYDPQTIQQELIKEEFGIVVHALQNKKDPAAVLYEMAKSSGYVKQRPQAQQDDKIVRIQDGQRRAASPLTAAGGAPRKVGRPTIVDIANMDQAEFEEKLKDPNWFRKIAGG